MAETKKYYWLKLQRDFFKRHDIQIIESMPNGEKYLIFYLKLLCESLDHNGNLRFSDEIPYEVEMLATITHMDIDTVTAAVKLFTNLKMMNIMDDGTFFMSQVLSLTGDETKWAEKKRLYREGQKKTLSDKSIELRDKSIELRDKNNNTPDKPETRITFIKPTLNEIKEYCKERKNNVDPSQWLDYYSSNGWKVGRNKMIDWKAAVRTWERNKFDSKTYSKPIKDLSNGYILPEGMDELPGEMR